MKTGCPPTAVRSAADRGVIHELPAETPVALETGTMAFFVARHLRALDLQPIVVDAREVRMKASRPTQKSDRRDALELCEGLRRGIYRTLAHVPPLAITQLRETLGRRRHFVRLKTMQVNAAKRLLRSVGQGPLARSLGTERAWSRLVAALALDPTLQAFVGSHHAVWRCAQEQVAALEVALRAQQLPLQPELDAGRPQHPLHPYFVSLCVRRGYRMAIDAVAHRLCRILLRCCVDTPTSIRPASASRRDGSSAPPFIATASSPRWPEPGDPVRRPKPRPR